MITKRDTFLEKNQSRRIFILAIDIPRRIFWDFYIISFEKKNFRREDLYPVVYNYCRELRNCLKEAGEKRRLALQ